MAELTIRKRQIWQVVEQGYIGRGNPVHGTFSSQEEAWARYQEVARGQPALVTMGALGVTSRDVETVEEQFVPKTSEHTDPKMLRGYEDKMARQERVLK